MDNRWGAAREEGHFHSPEGLREWPRGGPKVSSGRSLRTAPVVLWILLPLLFPPALEGQHGLEDGSTSGTLVVTVSVDWEGYSLSESDLSAFASFRELFPSVPLTHFLNAAYYTRNASAAEVTSAIRAVMRPGDEIGLHVHCWRSLVTRAGVEFREGPRFWDDSVSPVRVGEDDGFDVELAAYSAEEVEKLAATSRDILKRRGFTLSRSFRAGGWMASGSVLQGIRAAGFTVDSSATDRSWHRDELGNLPLYRRLGELWGDVTQDTQPYRIKTPAGTVLEMPDTGALADYVSGMEMSEHLGRQLGKLEPGSFRFAHIGFHQETCRRFVPRLIECLTKWIHHRKVRFRTLTDAAALFEAQAQASPPAPERNPKAVEHEPHR
jgi:hypothetical protein